MKKDIYYIAAKNLLKWTPEQRRSIMDKLVSPYERECVRQNFVEIIRHHENLNCIELNLLVSALIRQHGRKAKVQA